MNAVKQRIKIAKARGYTAPYWRTFMSGPDILSDGETGEPIPDYLNDLNAMHEAWKEYFGFYSEEWLHAHSHLKQVLSCSLGEDDMDDPYVVAAIANATAAQRAEAFLMTLGLWEEGGEA